MSNCLPRGCATLNSRGRGGEGRPPRPRPPARPWHEDPDVGPAAPHPQEEGLRCSQPPWAGCALRGWPAGPPGTFLFLFGYCYVALLDMLGFFFFQSSLYAKEISLFILGARVTSPMPQAARGRRRPRLPMYDLASGVSRLRVKAILPPVFLQLVN